MNASLSTSPAILTPSPERLMFDWDALLESSGTSAALFDYDPSDIIFSQGDSAAEVMYIQRGRVKKSVTSRGGKEAVVAVLGPGEFLGEECLAGQPDRTGTATAMTASTVLTIGKAQMFSLLRRHSALADQFLSYTLARIIRGEADLLDLLINPSEKRLARALLLLARNGRPIERTRVVPKLSDAALAEIVGTTRSRVNILMNKFRRLGFIDYRGRSDLTINRALLRIVREDD